MEQSPTRRRDVLTLQEACHALDAAEMYEQCNEVYQVCVWRALSSTAIVLYKMCFFKNSKIFIFNDGKEWPRFCKACMFSVRARVGIDLEYTFSVSIAASSISPIHSVSLLRLSSSARARTGVDRTLRRAQGVAPPLAVLCAPRGHHRQAGRGRADAGAFRWFIRDTRIGNGITRAIAAIKIHSHQMQ